MWITYHVYYGYNDPFYGVEGLLRAYVCSQRYLVVRRLPIVVTTPHLVTHVYELCSLLMVYMQFLSTILLAPTHK